jgi:hypothetical protein
MAGLGEAGMARHGVADEAGRGRAWCREAVA